MSTSSDTSGPPLPQPPRKNDNLKGLLQGVVDSNWFEPSEATDSPSTSTPTAATPSDFPASDSRGSTDPLLPDNSESAHSETMIQQTMIQASPSLQFGGYELLQEIARGGMGVVYKARQLALDRTVALKLVLSGKDASSSEVSRFHIEAKAAARLDHPHIVPVYEIGEFNGQQFFSMGFVDGPSLSVRLSKEGPLPYREAAELMRKVAEAVHYAHRLGVVHRDLKPGNVLITAEGEPKVTDFGLAKRLDSQQSLTATGQILGTPSYMAPEQALGDNSAIGPWTDIYSLGATLFAALVGRPPFVGTAIHELLINVVEQPAPSLRSINPQIPAGLDAIVLKCLGKTANERYATAADLAAALKDFLEADRVTPPRRNVGLRVVAMVTTAALVLAAIFGGMWLGRQGASDSDDNRTAQKATTSTTSPDEGTKSDAVPNQPVAAQTPEQKHQLALLAARETLLPDAKGDVWKFRYSDAGAEFDRVFRELGFNVGQTDVASWAEPLKDRPAEFRESILLALEIWEASAFADKQVAQIEPLRQAQEALESLDWRRTIRLARTDGDEKILLQAIREALSSSPSAEQVEWLALLVASRSPEKNPEALGVLRGLIQEAPKSFVTNSALAVALRGVAQARPGEGTSFLSESILPLRAAAKIRPTAPLPQAQLVAVYHELGNAEAARVESERLFQLSYPVAWPLVLEARKARDAKQFPEAITLLRRALKADDDVPSGKVELAAALVLNKQDSEAEPLFQQLAEAAADDGSAYQSLTDVFRIVDQVQSGATKIARDPKAPNPYSDRIWSLFSSVRRKRGSAPPSAVNPFSADQAKAHQEAWAQHLGVPVEYTNSIGMRFRLIPPGEFRLGNTQPEIQQLVEEAKKIDPNGWFVSRLDLQLNNSVVVISKPYYMGVTEVTQREFQTITGSNPSVFSKFGTNPELATRVANIDTAQHPVDSVTWNDMTQFCVALSEKEAWIEPDSNDARSPRERGLPYRIPTESEWEFACRAGTDTAWWFGDKGESAAEFMWLGQQTSQPCGQKPANPFGLHDMHGNAWERCEDLWRPYTELGTKPRLIDPCITKGDPLHVCRGGAWDCFPFLTASRFRASSWAATGQGNTGFRLTLSVEAVRQRGKESNQKPTTENEGPPRAVAPFSAELASAQQEAWAKQLGIPVEYTNSIGMKFRLIPAGEFIMGSTPEVIEASVKPFNGVQPWIDAARSEGPRHKVVITRPFYLGIHELTQAAYERIMGSNPSEFASTGARKDAVPADTSQYPVDSATQLEAVEFCRLLTAHEKMAGQAYRLPTEAEWEFACGSGTSTDYYSGNTTQDLEPAAWFGVNSDRRSHPVGEKKPNAFGLFDMHGNLFEWVHDAWDANYYQQFADQPATDPQGTNVATEERVLRGGAWMSHLLANRTQARLYAAATTKNPGMGLRVALSVDAVRVAIERANSPAAAIAPFDAEKAREHQEAWARYLGVPVEYTNSVGMKFRLIPPGEYTRGANKDEVDAAAIELKDPNWIQLLASEAPPHRVIITSPFYLGISEVTQGQYELATKSNPSYFAPTGTGAKNVVDIDHTLLPVEQINWQQANSLCRLLGEKEKRAAESYLLPTEAEWEFACRAGTTSKFWSGDTSEDLAKSDWVGANYTGRTHAVATLPANPFGLFDLHGNVWEFCRDAWDRDAYQQFNNKPAIDPVVTGKKPIQIMLRGGDVSRPALLCRASVRHAGSSEFGHASVGVRLWLRVESVQREIFGSLQANQKQAASPVPAISPFNADESKNYQEAWAKYVGVPVEYTNSIGMQFVLIPPGEFVMGSTADEIEVALKDIPADATVWRRAVMSEAPQHRVVTTRPFYLGRHKVTQQDYEVVMKATPSYFSVSGPGKDAVANTDTKKHPVESISWNDAAEFCEKLSATEGLQPAYRRNDKVVTRLTGNGYQLPTEAQWEFACRAGTTTRYFSGDRDQDLADFGWSGGKSAATTKPVGSLKPNSFGAFDLHGNVWEWVADAWDENYYKTSASKVAVDPICSDDTLPWRVLRGGVWAGATSYCRSSARHTVPPTYGDRNVGFRISLPVEAVRKLLQQANTPPLAVAPFEATKALRHQEDWAKHLGVPVEYTNSIGMKFRLIPPGQFTMGSTPAEAEQAVREATGQYAVWHSNIRSEVPQHDVLLTRPFYLGQFEVTQKQYESVAGKNPSHFATTGPGKDVIVGMDTATFPVDRVTWYDAVEFCEQLSSKEQLRPFRFDKTNERLSRDGNGYRLPTEAEFEFACRAGTTSKFDDGDDPALLKEWSWYVPNNAHRIHAVGELKANPFGLFDMRGNAFEWVQDWWAPDYYAQGSSQTAIDPTGPLTGRVRVRRGGSWGCPALFLRSASRNAILPEPSYLDIGFRVVLTVDAVKLSVTTK